MGSLRMLVVLIAIFFIIAITPPAYAGSGAFRDESVDAATVAMGNAFVGQADTPAAVYYNPAGMNQIDAITTEANLSVLAPRASFKNTSGNTTKMQNDEYEIPDLYTVIPVIKNKLTLGIGSGSYWGLGTDWSPDSFSRYVATKSVLANTDTMLTAAYQVTNQWSVAAGADNDYSQADESRLVPQIGINGVTNAGEEAKVKDDAWGYRLATLFKINDSNQVGLMYRSPISHEYIGKIYLDNLVNPTLGIPFNTIFGGSSYQTRITEKLVLPQSVVIGYSYKPTRKWTINFDLEWMDWSSIKHELISFPDVAPGSAISQILNTGNPLVHDWHSAWTENIGTEYAVTDRFRLRAGFFHNPEVGPGVDFDSAIIDSNTFGFTGGFGYDITKNLTIDIGYAALASWPRKVNPILGQGLLDGKYYGFSNDGSVSLTYKF